jgi:hypothetical protein
MGMEAVDADSTTCPAQDYRRDGNVIDRAQARNEVRDQVDRTQQIDEQTPEGHLRTARCACVAYQREGETNQVRDQPKGRSSHGSRWSMEPDGGHEQGPGRGKHAQHDDDVLGETHRRMVAEGRPGDREPTDASDREAALGKELPWPADCRIRGASNGLPRSLGRQVELPQEAMG